MGTLEAGIVGSRGYVGAELSRKIAAHPYLNEVALDARGDTFAEGVPHVVFLALPKGLSHGYAQEITRRERNSVVIDLSPDHRRNHRFSDPWVYGLSEHNRKEIRDADRISNPGCFATGMQLGIKPALEMGDSIDSITVSGTSGYSGAGKAPSRKNDLEVLGTNHVVPYGSIDHPHEEEVAQHLGLGESRVVFMPRVGNFFRGMVIEIRMRNRKNPVTEDQMRAHYANYYEGEPMITITEESPDLGQVVGTDMCYIGGFQARGRDMALTVVLDNLGKGAAGQALQNLNTALGIRETTGLVLSEEKPRER